MANAVKISKDLYKDAKTMSIAEHRSISGQIEYWAQLGKIAKENPDLTMEFIEEILISDAEYKAGQFSEFKID
jgi:hypothetical protein